MATQAFVDLTGLQYYDGKLQERIAGTYATKAAYVGATSSANGTAGLVPAASSAQRGNFLRGDGTWTEAQTAKEIGYSTSEPTTSSTSSLDNESVIFYETQNMAAGVSSVAALSISGNASTADSVNHSMSISVDGGAVEGASLYTFNGSAEKTVNIAGGTGISLTGVSGTVTINANPFHGATASVNGTAGMVPASTVAEKDRFLRGDGTWAEVVQPAIVTSGELSTGTDTTVRTISPKVIHDYVAGIDSNVVHKTGNETIAGTKTFSSIISGSIDGSSSALATNGNPSAHTKLYYTVGQPAIGTSVGNSFKGSSNDASLLSFPENGTTFTTTTANIQNIRMMWKNSISYFTDIFVSPNNHYIWHRDVMNGTAFGWRRLVEEDVTGITPFAWNISIAGTAEKATQDASGNVITTTYATKNELPADYVGATANANGTHGLVPAATSAEKDNFLCADGTWDSITGMTNAQIDTAMANVGYAGNIDPSLLTTITNSEIDALFA